MDTPSLAVLGPSTTPGGRYEKPARLSRVIVTAFTSNRRARLEQSISLDRPETPWKTARAVGSAVSASSSGVASFFGGKSGEQLNSRRLLPIARAVNKAGRGLDGGGRFASFFGFLVTWVRSMTLGLGVQGDSASPTQNQQFTDLPWFRPLLTIDAKALRAAHF